MLKELVPLKWNPNALTNEERRRLRASIRENSAARADWDPAGGYRLATTVTVNRQGMRIVGGAHRVGELKGLGQDWIHGEDISWVDLRPDCAAEKALNTSLNNRAAQGEMDQAKLNLILADIEVEAPEMFSSLELGDLRADVGDSPDTSDQDPDAAPELPETPVSRPGELYRLGDHFLLCGDCTDPENIARFLDAAGGNPSLVFTDPPYNMAYKSKKLGGIRNDSLEDAAFVRLILGSTRSIQTALAGRGAYYVCMGTGEYATVAQQLKRLGLDHRLIIWAKPSTGLGSQDYRPQVELILYGSQGKKGDRTWNAGRRESDLWAFDLDRGLLAWEDEEGGTVLEFTDGTGSTKLLLDQPVSGTVIREDGSMSDVWRCSRAGSGEGDTGEYVHPTQKPVALVERAVKKQQPKR